MRSETIRIATFNIQHGRTPSGEVDIELLARCCVALDADVLGLQEVDRNLRRSHDADTAAVVAEATGMEHVYGPAIAVRGGEYGNALLVRGAIDDVEVIPLADEEPRCGIVATAVVGGMRLSVVTAHLGLRGQAHGQLPVLLDALRARPGPRALFGDLNLDPDDVAAPGFTRVETDATWPVARPRRTIDHVLLDGLTERAAVVAPLPVSDHLAVVVEVQAP